MNEEKHFYLRIIKYGYDNPGGFGFNDIVGFLKPNEQQKTIIINNLKDAVINSNNDSHIRTMFRAINIKQPAFPELYSNSDTRFIIDYDAFFNYLDYLELKEARENARQASKYAHKSISIAIAGIILTFCALLVSIVTLYK